MSLSDIMAIEVMFHFSHYRTFKDFYVNTILKNYRKELPQAISYTKQQPSGEGEEAPPLSRRKQITP